eukprot:CAMPEP_0113935810 /NCGR_PEP_ID=MMETSP1339-20121228/2875_1 /TAXON_ID=94617 /ORGANISM="Fibrocapsa japonica" /LENGTH=363 /DNA_ID=CAMNT_0000938079 /DNA_START=63 /DNA_END=1154 /DNA_ORIENTATION=+ /assembly_acc=CAM_ASM_000762
MALFIVKSALRNARHPLRAQSIPFFREASSLVVKYHKRGDPKKCLQVEKEDVDITPGQGEVAFKMMASPINPSDLNMIEGTYDILPELPAVGGNEGVAEVTAVGSGVSRLNVGDWVVPATPGFGHIGTWREIGKASESNFLKVPNVLPKEYAACAAVNPCTALHLLSNFVELKEGDVVIQNGSTSVVGQCVTQIAKAKGIRTINVFRRRPQFEYLMQHTKDLGGDIVCFEDYLNGWQYKRLMADLPKPKLALDCAGGVSSTQLARALGPGGVMVNYGGMSKKPVTLPTSSLLHNDISVKGFWLTKWNQENSLEARQAVLDEVCKMMTDDKLKIWLEHHPMFDAEFSLKKATEPYYFRKIVMTM